MGSTFKQFIKDLNSKGVTADSDFIDGRFEVFEGEDSYLVILHSIYVSDLIILTELNKNSTRLIDNFYIKYLKKAYLGIENKWLEKYINKKFLYAPKFVKITDKDLNNKNFKLVSNTNGCKEFLYTITKDTSYIIKIMDYGNYSILLRQYNKIPYLESPLASEQYIIINKPLPSKLDLEAKIDSLEFYKN